MAISNSLTPEQLALVQKSTVGHYSHNAQSFWDGTKDHDVSQNYQALLSHCPQNRALDILDFGCGPGRDLIYFSGLGHRPVGLDGSPVFCEMASKVSGCKVLCQEFLKLDLPAKTFDAVFANASLFHIPSQALPKVLKELHASLRPKGILFSSNPRGDAEGWNGDRYGNYMEFDKASLYFKNAGFEVLSHYYRPKGLPREQQPWLAMVSRAITASHDTTNMSGAELMAQSGGKD